jgi:glycerophosphoryl diester phosphodiesterase
MRLPVASLGAAALLLLLLLFLLLRLSGLHDVPRHPRDHASNSNPIRTLNKTGNDNDNSTNDRQSMPSIYSSDTNNDRPMARVAAAPEASASSCHPLTLSMSDKVRRRDIPQGRRLIIAHRGASAHLPEHTLPSYRLALELGADWVEPDLLATADGVLIALHSMDLAIATDVQTKFPNRPPWFSPRANRTGYWAFNYTAAEIATLTVQPTADAVADGRLTALFPLSSPTNNNDAAKASIAWGVPTLTDVVQTVVDWNTLALPRRFPDPPSTSPPADTTLRRPSDLQLHQAGVYAELKDTQWLREEAGIDLVQLVHQHLQEHQELWQSLLPCFDEMPFDAYKVPGLVLQSFEATALTDFANAWRQPDTSSSSSMPEPLYVLLVDEHQCQDEQFWFRQVGDTPVRDLVSAIGCHKACLVPPGSQKGSTYAYTVTHLKAEEYGLQLHAWTERPEYRHVVREPPRFDSAWEEMRFLFCDVGIQAVFAEAVGMAVTAATVPCDADGTTDKDAHNTNNDHVNPQFCYESESEAGFFTALAAFAVGVFVTGLFFVSYGRHCLRWQSNLVPSAEPSHALRHGGRGQAVSTPQSRGAYNGRGGERDHNHEDHDDEEDDHHWQSTAAAVDAWRSDQLAVAAALAADQDEEEGQFQGLEMT